MKSYYLNIKRKKVTRERLYIDAMQEVLGSSSKVLVDVKGGNNMMYLPLDKMMKKQGTATRVALPSSSDINDYAIKLIHRAIAL